MIHRDESGYSIVEVMVAVLILMVAVLPMFKMFDVGLQTAIRSSDYDRARALAEKQTEIAHSITFASLSSNFPFSCPEPDACIDARYPDLRFSVEKTPSKLPDGTSGGDITIEEDTSGAESQMMKIVITVYEEGDEPDDFIFETIGVIANHDG